MSLWSIISGNSSQSSASYVSAGYSTAVSKLQSDSSGSAATDTASKSASSDTGVSISANAQAAAAEADDNKKDFTDLANEIRSSLDTLYAAEDKAGKAKSANFSQLSGRALSAVVLNQGGKFSASEVRQAKTALDNQTRDDFKAAMQSGMSMSGLASYSQSLVTQYDSMSDEERQARGWTQSFRDNAAKVVSTGSLSLFDQMDSDDS
jgi:hypothetical protein